MSRRPINPLGKISVLVFEDLNANGKRDACKRGLVSILLRDTRGRLYRRDSEGKVEVLAGEELVIQVDIKLIPSYPILSTLPCKNSLK